MGSIEPRVRKFLQTTFPGMRVHLETLPSGRVTGTVIWDGFVNDDQVARQARIRTALKNEFDAQVQEISVLLTYTPDEIQEMTAV
ncbi:MAG: hypothetical protein OHK0029_39270 [Armatimonadaceae bacterium]